MENKEFNLSDKEELAESTKEEWRFYCYPKKDVKEFIKILKTDLIMLMLEETFSNKDVRRVVDKLAGGDLI